MSDGVHAELALKPHTHCPLGRVVDDYAVKQFVPAGAETPPQVVLDADSVVTDDEPADDDATGERATVDKPALYAVEETKETVICRLVDPESSRSAAVEQPRARPHRRRRV